MQSNTISLDELKVYFKGIRVHLSKPLEEDKVRQIVGKILDIEGVSKCSLTGGTWKHISSLK